MDRGGAGRNRTKRERDCSFHGGETHDEAVCEHQYFLLCRHSPVCHRLHCSPDLFPGKGVVPAVCCKTCCATVNVSLGMNRKKPVQRQHTCAFCRWRGKRGYGSGSHNRSRGVAPATKEAGGRLRHEDGARGAWAVKGKKSGKNNPGDYFFRSF